MPENIYTTHRANSSFCPSLGKKLPSDESQVEVANEEAHCRKTSGTSEQPEPVVLTQTSVTLTKEAVVPKDDMEVNTTNHIIPKDDMTHKTSIQDEEEDEDEDEDKAIITGSNGPHPKRFKSGDQVSYKSLSHAKKSSGNMAPSSMFLEMAAAAITL